MGMSMHDRYYEPEDDEYGDMDEYVADWVKFEMRDGGWCDPKEPSNFGEAVGQLQLREELSCWDDCTPAEKEQITAYWKDIANTLAEEAFYERNY